MTTQAPPPTIAPRSVAALIERIDGDAAAWPRRLRQCARFTRRHLHLIAVSTVAEMAAAAEVAPSVYVRFCQAMGFSGYSELQALLREGYSEFRPDYGTRLASLRGGRAGGALPVDRLIADFADAGHKSLLRLGNTVTSEAVERIARDMAAARVVHLVGARWAHAVVANMAYLLERMGVEARLHPGPGLYAFEGQVRAADAVFAVTFAPFSPETVAFAARGAEAGAAVHGLSDVDACPLAGPGREVLIAREDEVAGLRAPTAAIVLTTALCVAAGAFRAER